MSSAIIRCIASLVIWCWCAAAWSQDPTAHCVDRIASTGSSAAFDRLPNVRYTCMELGSGKHVLVVEGGDAAKPAVVLVHGLGNNAHRDWRATFPALAQGYRVIALDLPGFGSSEAPAQRISLPLLADALGEVADRLALRRFHLVGHSLGGAVALYYAQRHPQQIDHLALVDIAGIFIKPVFLRFLLETNAENAGLDSTLGALGSLLPGGTEAMLDALQDRSDLGRLLMDSPAVRSALFGDGAIGDAALDLLDYDLTVAIRDVRVPTAVIWGSADPVTPRRAGTLLAARMHDAKLYIVDGAEHMPMNQRPAAFNPILLTALSQSPGSGGTATAIDGTPRGSVRCKDQSGVRYTGTYESISLQNCTNVLITNARAGSVKALNSSLKIESSIIDGKLVALDAADSSVTATAVSLKGRVAIRASASRLDLAGVSLHATEKGLDMTGASRAYFSVSDYDAPDYRGDAHFAWPPPQR